MSWMETFKYKTRIRPDPTSDQYQYSTPRILFTVSHFATHHTEFIHINWMVVDSINFLQGEEEILNNLYEQI